MLEGFDWVFFGLLFRGFLVDPPYQVLLVPVLPVQLDFNRFRHYLRAFSTGSCLWVVCPSPFEMSPLLSIPGCVF